MVYGHDQQFAGMALIVKRNGGIAQLRTTLPDRSRETGLSNSFARRQSIH